MRDARSARPESSGETEAKAEPPAREVVVAIVAAAAVAFLGAPIRVVNIMPVEAEAVGSPRWVEAGRKQSFEKRRATNRDRQWARAPTEQA
ncbi:MAG: hypothetical protein SF069_10865 [Phycisphaerae bacterium]|nr:hypothetical protein [Phycisphaerae bacterium]